MKNHFDRIAVRVAFSDKAVTHKSDHDDRSGPDHSLIGKVNGPKRIENIGERDENVHVSIEKIAGVIFKDFTAVCLKTQFVSAFAQPHVQ